jgi:Chromate resistance exported protein
MKWVTRARPVIDRIACPWLIARFIDKEAEFLFVAPDRVQAVAEETGAIPYDVPGVELSHVGGAAASTPSSSSTGWRSRRSMNSRALCGAPTPSASIWPRNRLGCSPSRWASARALRMTSRCCATASCSTTRSTAGAGSSKARRTAGHPR